jgi:hypothetical protein
LEKSAVPRMIPDLMGVCVHAEHTYDLAVFLETDGVVAVESSDALGVRPWEVL